MHQPNSSSFLTRIGVIDMTPIEPVIFAALITVTGYSFSGIHAEFHGLFPAEKDCIEDLKQTGVVIDG